VGLGEHNDTLSIGKVALADLRISRDVSDLLIKVVGTTDVVRIKSWYTSASNQTFDRLQVVTDSATDYAPGSADVLRSGRVTTLDFGKLVTSFDAAKAANPSLVDWQPTESAMQLAFRASSDSLGFGGGLAYGYAHNGTVAGAAYATATAQLAASAFGTAAQDIGVALVGLSAPLDMP
jgi:hypothetical protein